jgi:carboxylate-amine ligase
MLDMAKTREVFEASEDFTVGIEEEFAIIDRETRDLVPHFEGSAVRGAARRLRRRRGACRVDLR